MQSLKETFAAKLPGEIERIKRLKKLVASPTSLWPLQGLILSNQGIMDQKLSVRLHSIRSTAEPVG